MAFFTPQQRQTLLWLGIGLMLFVLLVLLGPILLPFIAGTILAYALNPVVDRLHSIRIKRFRLSRTLATVIVMGVLFAVTLTTGFIVIPLLFAEWPLLYQQIPTIAVKIVEFINPILLELGAEEPLDPTRLRKMITHQILPQGEGLWRHLLATAKFGGTTALTVAWNAILIPVVLFFLLKDWHPFIRRIREFIPRRWVHQVVRFANEVNAMLAQYLRGQLSVMLILAVYYSTALTIAGYNVALPVGIISGMLAFIPYVGITVGLSLAIVATLLQFSGAKAWLILVAIYGFGHTFDVLFMTPTLVGRRIQLHPLLVIFALLAFGQLIGFVGVLIALPSSAILSVAFKHLRRHYFNSSFYRS